MIVEKIENHGVVYFTLNRPKAGNSLSLKLLKDLRSQIDAISEDEESKSTSKVVIIRSIGPIFCSGHDLKEIKGIYGKDEATQKKSFEELFQVCNGVMNAIRESRLIFIAQVEGIATGSF